MKKVVISNRDLIENIAIIKQRAKEKGPNDNGEETKIIAVVKGNGYGLGIVEFTNFLIKYGFDFFAVATIEEALILRQAGIEQDILLLSSTCIEEEIESLIDNDIILTIGSNESSKRVNNIAKKKGKIVKAHIIIDTGMGRHGFLYNKPEELVLAIKEFTNIDILGTFSHFSQSFSKDKKWTETQFNRFINVIEVLKMNDINYGMLHICNSEAFFKYDEMHLNAVRVGAAFLGRTINKYNLKRVGMLKTAIVEIKTLPKGYNIGYGNTCKTKKETKIGVIPIGYADGFNLDNKEQIFKFIPKLRNSVKAILKNENQRINIAGIQYKVLGQVGMNHMIVDITGSNIEVGQEVYIDLRPAQIDSGIKREYV